MSETQLIAARLAGLAAAMTGWDGTIKVYGPRFILLRSSRFPGGPIFASEDSVVDFLRAAYIENDQAKAEKILEAGASA